MKTIDYGSFVVMKEGLKERYTDASCSVLLILYDRGAKNVAVYKRISGSPAEIKKTGDKFNFIGKHSEFVILTQDHKRFLIAIPDTADDGKTQIHLIGKRGDKQGISAILVFNRDMERDFRFNCLIEQDSAMRYRAFSRRLSGKDIHFLDEFLEPLLAALPERFDLELFINQAIGNTEKFVREMRDFYD